MMQRIENWSGKIEDTAIEYDVIKTEGANINNPVDQAATAVFIGEYDKADRTDYVIAACSGVLTGLLDSFWVGEFSLEAAQLWGKSNINHFVINGEWYLVDLAGYGYAKRSKKDTEKFEHMITTYILDREQMTNLFLLIDVRHEPQQIDLEFMEWLGENGVPFSIVFTKADKVSKAKLNGNVMHYLTELKKQWEELPPYFVTSSETKMGREEILNYIEEINRMLAQEQ